MSSTFGTLTTVRLGIYAAQKGLDVTGNNITNINTTGYTRQRLDQVSLIAGASDKYASEYHTRVGQGVLLNGVTQLRDPGLDISYRTAQSNIGAADQKLAGLEALANILDEVGKGDDEQDDGVLLSQLNDLRDLINKALAGGIENYEGDIRSVSNSLTATFHQYAADLEELTDTYEGYLEQDIDQVNKILTNLRDLNEAIRNADIRGDDALELRDTRNLLLDELSQYMKIDVTYSTENLGAGLTVERMTVKLATGDHNTLVDGEYATQLLSTGKDNNYALNLYALRDADGNKKVDTDTDPVLLGDTDLYGSLQSLRELLTEKGEYADANAVTTDPNAGTKRGIPYYQAALDSLARTFAKAMNDLNKAAGIDGAGNLFSNSGNSDAADNITAANISVSQSWSNGKVHMLSSTEPNAPSDDRSNLEKFLAVFTESHTFETGAGTIGDGKGYEGSFEDMLLNMQSTLAQDQRSTTTILNNYVLTADSIALDRESVSGVDLNDEAANLMVYQKAYTAACRVMTVIQDVLDTLINSMIV